MANMKIKEIRCMSAYKLQGFCIHHDYFNKGTNEEYSAMFDLVYGKNGYNVDNERIYQVAKSIYEHTVFPYDDILVTDIMNALAREVVETYYEIEDDE